MKLFKKNIYFFILLNFTLHLLFSQINPKIIIRNISKKHSPPFWAYGIMDVKGNFNDYYYSYIQYTKYLEDEHYSSKTLISKNKDKMIIQLIFKHWLIGELFRIQEEHEFYKKAEWVIINKDLKWKGKKRAKLWLIKKYLLPKTKSSWVGNRLKYLNILISFIDMGKNKTRIYYKIGIDASGRRSPDKVKEEVRKFFKNILHVYKIYKKK